MDTDRCIQKLVRTELEGSECTQCKIENTAQYWAAQEKEAAMNYHHVLDTELVSIQQESTTTVLSRSITRND